MDRRTRPALESLEGRALLAAPTVVFDADTGATELAQAPGYGTGDAPLTPYLAGVLDCRGAAPTPVAPIDTAGYGGHGTIMAGILAAGCQARNLPLAVYSCITTDARGMLDTGAIGRAESLAAGVQRAHPDWRVIVTVPAGPGSCGPAEFQGRLALQAARVPLVTSAGDGWYHDGTPADFSRTGMLQLPVGPGQFVATVAGSAAVNHGGAAVPVAVDARLGTSGAAMVLAADLDAGQIPLTFAPAPVGPPIHARHRHRP